MTAIKIDCREVILEISNFIDCEVTPEMRQRMEAHFSECAHCLAILDGTRNILTLVGDGHAFDVPAGFGERLAARLRSHHHE